MNKYNSKFSSLYYNIINYLIISNSCRDGAEQIRITQPTRDGMGRGCEITFTDNILIGGGG